MVDKQKQSHGASEISYYQAVATAPLRIQLLAREPLSEHVHRLRFASLSPFRWAAGQHLVVLRAGDEELFLPYSIASAYDPKRAGEFEIAAAFHAGAGAMDALAIGAELEAEGPAGTFVWQTNPSPAALLVGVGTGIAPLRALIQEELGRSSETRLLLLAGHRAPEDVLFQDYFTRLAAAAPRFRFVPTLTGAAAHWLGGRGRVQVQLAEAVHSLGPLDAYVCGRLDMVTEVVNALQVLGVPAARVRSEGY
jgi:CDP-4-dehydro-6-deoxyglucose reductase, E3